MTGAPGERKLDEHYEAERLLGLLHELPEGFTIGVLPDQSALSADFSIEQLAEIMSALPPQSGAAGGMLIPGQPVHMFAIGTSQPATQFVAMSTDEQAAWVTAQLTLLLPIYRFIVWTRDNDFVSMAKVLDKEKTVRRQRGFQKGDRVRIVRGMLAGKDGAVAEVDAKGLLKIIVGKMVIKIDASDVERANA